VLSEWKKRKSVALAAMASVFLQLVPASVYAADVTDDPKSATTKVDPNVPWTESHGVDTRFMTKEAAGALWACGGSKLKTAAVKDPYAAKTILAACMPKVRDNLEVKKVGVCTNSLAFYDPASCRSLDYYQSWCGAMTQASELCIGELTRAVNDYAASKTAAPVKNVAVPLSVSTVAGKEKHYLETAPGYTIGPNPSDYYEWDRFIPAGSLEYQLLRGQTTGSTTSPPLPGTGTTPGTGTIAYSIAYPKVILSDDPAFRGNGERIASCAEYAVEKTYGFVKLDDWARLNVASNPEIFRALFSGNGVVGPHITATDTIDFRDKDGALVPYQGPSWDLDDNLVVFRTGEELRGGHRFFGELTTDTIYTSRYRLNLVPTGTPRWVTWKMKNVYIYVQGELSRWDPVYGPLSSTGSYVNGACLQALANGTYSQQTGPCAEQGVLEGTSPPPPPPPPGPDFERWYEVSIGWHKQMAQALSWVHPDHLEELDRLQIELLAKWKDYHYKWIWSFPCRIGGRTGMHCDSQARFDAIAEADALRVKIDEAIADAALLGCLPANPDDITPCDWAPRLAADPIHDAYESHTRRLYDRCVSEHEDPILDNNALDAIFLNPWLVLPEPQSAFAAVAGTVCPLSQSSFSGNYALTNAQITACQLQFKANDHTANPAALERYWRDRFRYLQVLEARMAQDYGNDGALWNTSNYEKSIGNSTAGLAVRFDSEAGYDPAQARICDKGPAMGNHASIDISLFGLPVKQPVFDHKIDVANEWSDWHDGYHADHGASWGTYTQPPPSLSDYSTASGVDAKVRDSLAIGGNFIYNEEEVGASVQASTTPYRFAVGAGVSARLPAGPIDFVLSAGIEGSVGITLSHSVSYLATRDSSAAGCGAWAFTTAVSVSPFAGVDGFFSAGVAAGPIEVGLKGVLTLVKLSLPITLSAGLTAQDVDPDGDGATDRVPVFNVDLDADLVLTMMSGRVSVYFALNLWAVTITIFELVLFQFEGPQLRLSQLDEYMEGKWPCLIQEVRSIVKGVRKTDRGCACFLLSSAECSDSQVLADSAGGTP
jgi:hypothetical protein